MLEPPHIVGISKPDTCWQHLRPPCQIGGVTCREPANNDPSASDSQDPCRRSGRHRGDRRSRLPAAAVLVFEAASPIEVLRGDHRGAFGEAVPSEVWPTFGQAAFVQGGRSQVQAGPNQHAAPIASVAKVMTAYLVLRDHPLRPGEAGPTITLTDADVADTDRRRGQGSRSCPSPPESS